MIPRSVSNGVRLRALGRCERCRCDGDLVVRGEHGDAGTYMLERGEVFDDSTGTGIALALAGTTDEGRSDAAKLARGARRLRVRGTQLAPPARATEIDVVEADVSPLDVLRVRADVARDRVEMLDAVAELGLYAAQVAHLAADAWRFDGQRLDTTDSVEALTLATALARKAGAL